MRNSLDVGVLFPFRNPPKWHRPFPRYYSEQLAQVQYAEKLGFDTVWLTEHHFSEDGYCPSLLPIASAIAAMTSRIRIATNLIILPLHNAVRVAEDAAVVDILSNGRLDLGVGRGYSKSEFEGYGVSRNERTSRLKEGVEVIQGLWTQEEFSYQGRHYQIKNARLAPRPVQMPHPPLWVGTHGPKTLAWMARSGLHFLSAGNPVSQRMFDDCVRDAGRSPEDFNAAQLCWVHVAPTWEQAWDNVEAHLQYMFAAYADWLADAGDLTEEQRPMQPPPLGTLRHTAGDEIGVLLIGSPDQVAARIAELRRTTRMTHLVLGMHLPGLDPLLSRASMDLFAQAILPSLRCA